jgi:hypothetical protein
MTGFHWRKYLRKIPWRKTVATAGEKTHKTPTKTMIYNIAPMA